MPFRGVVCSPIGTRQVNAESGVSHECHLQPCCEDWVAQFVNEEILQGFPSIPFVQESDAGARIVRARYIPAQGHVRDVEAGCDVELFISNEFPELRGRMFRVNHRDPVSYTHLRAHETPE